MSFISQQIEELQQGSKEAMRPHKFISVWVCGLFSYACCDVDLELILTRAAEKIAEDAGTSLDTFALARGLCFSAKDLSSGEIQCKDQPAGK